MSNALDDRDALLERRLDRALASYTPAAPMAGLEERIKLRLAGEAAREARRPWLAPGWGWAAVAGCAAAFLLAVVLVHFQAQVDPGNVAVDSVKPPQIAVPPAAHLTVAPRETLRPQAARRAAGSQRPGTHRQEEPTQQELIARLMAGGPESIASLARAAEEEEKPITLKPMTADRLVIEPMRIAPIRIDPLDD